MKPTNSKSSSEDLRDGLEGEKTSSEEERGSSRVIDDGDPEGYLATSGNSRRSLQCLNIRIAAPIWTLQTLPKPLVNLAADRDLRSRELRRRPVEDLQPLGLAAGGESLHEKPAPTPAKPDVRGSSAAGGVSIAAETGGEGASSDPQVKDKSPGMESGKSPSENQSSRKDKALGVASETTTENTQATGKDSSAEEKHHPGGGYRGRPEETPPRTINGRRAAEREGRRVAKEKALPGEKPTKNKSREGGNFWDKLSGKSEDPDAITPKKQSGWSLFRKKYRDRNTITPEMKSSWSLSRNKSKNRNAVSTTKKKVPMEEREERGEKGQGEAAKAEEGQEAEKEEAEEPYIVVEEAVRQRA
ncbi:hypothetical protein HOY80DRAFT_1039256 [Tuber brumale]|nr:hypothetical protein HOY80DRAFT_1039256 [Tuber brumale]